MSDKQKALISDDSEDERQRRYTECRRGFATMDECNSEFAAFQEAVKELRYKHRIAEVHVTCQLTLQDGGEFFSDFHFGSWLHMEPMTAWAFGRAQAERQEEMIELAKCARNAVQSRGRKQ